MINLLPKENKIYLKKEYLKRLALVSCLALAIVSAIGSTLLMPSAVFLFNYKKNLNKQMVVYSNNSKEAASLETEAAIKKLNSRLEFINNAGSLAGPSELLKEITKLGAVGLKINGLSYDKQKKKDISEEKIVIFGQAGRREDFLFFLDKLNKKFGEKKIGSPVSNIISEKDIKFTVTVSL